MVSAKGDEQAIQKEIMRMMGMLFQPKRAVRDIDFSDPAKKPSFKEFLLSMPMWTLTMKWGEKAPE